MPAPPGFKKIIPTVAYTTQGDMVPYNWPTYDFNFKDDPAVTQHGAWFAADIGLSTINTNQDNVNEWALLDLGTTSHFLLTTDPTANKKPALSPLRVTMPDGEHIQSTQKCDLDILLLPR